MADKKTDWKSKYFELRSKHINAIDVSFRLGFQEGLKAAELQNMQMQLQQAQQAAMAAPPGGMPPGGEMPPEEAMAQEGQMPPEGGEEGVPSPEEAEVGDEEVVGEEGSDELGSSIDELEQYVSKNEKIDFGKMMKSLHRSNVESKNSADLSAKHKKLEDILKKWE
jgi:hypothetical protein